jgi:hypothetical protein
MQQKVLVRLLTETPLVFKPFQEYILYQHSNTADINVAITHS